MLFEFFFFFKTGWSSIFSSKLHSRSVNGSGNSFIENSQQMNWLKTTLGTSGSELD